jgi:hypothetical protein
MQLAIHGTEYQRGIAAREESRGAQGRLNIGYHERCGEAFARGVTNGESQGLVRKRQKVVAVTAQGAELPATSAVPDAVRGRHSVVHKPFLDIARRCPVLADVYYHCVAHFFIPL